VLTVKKIGMASDVKIGNIQGLGAKIIPLRSFIENNP
jgi:hypothetical protein